MIDKIKSKLNSSRIIYIAIILLLLFMLAVLFAKNTPKPIKVLVVDGFSNHDWKKTTEFIRQTLEETSLFKVDVSTAPSDPDSAQWQTWLPEFSKYDVVIQNTNNIKKKKLYWSRQAQIALENYVKTGGGLCIFHSANNAFENWKEYDKMIGLGWRNKDNGTALEITETGQILRIPPGQGQGTYHGPRSDVVIKILNHHPINGDFPKSWKTPDLELYKYARGPAENLTVLSYAYDPGTEKNWPIDWVVQYGKGRVYNSTFGHLWKNQTDPDSMRCVGFETNFIRSIEWLATEKVTYPLPKDFPTADKISLRRKKQTQIQLKSPNERNIIVISQEPDRITYSINVDGSPLILPSIMGMDINGFPDANAWQIDSHKTTSVDQVWSPVWGKRFEIRNHFNQLDIKLKTNMNLIFRAYDDGLAFRYQINSTGKDSAEIKNELTEFNFAGDFAWYSYRRERAPYGPTPISEIDDTVDYPLLSESPDAVSIAITEAHLSDYPWAVFKSKIAKTSFSINTSEKPVTVSLPFQTPWRVLMVGCSTAELIDSDLIVNLNPKANKTHFEWLKPGYSFWDWRAWGYKAPDGFEYNLDLPSWKRFIDLACETGIPYLLLDANWYGPEFKPGSDPFTGEKAADVKKAIEYGKTKNVRLILYLNHVAAKKYGIEKILKAYSDWGAAGIKYGFMKIKSPIEKVKWTHKVVELCAKNHLLVNFHDGPVPPTGEEAYMPNFMNREFCHAQSDAKRVSGPADFIKMANVNMLAGPLDMNHGMFDLLNSLKDRPRMFKQLDSTILAEAARTLITYGGAVPIIPDAADFYRQHLELFTFISKQKLPWTQSKTLQSKMPEYISMMRQTGETYLVASVTDESARDLTIDLSFLPAGKTFKATIFSDKPETHYINNRMAYEISHRQVTSNDKLNIHIAPGSGHCMTIELK